MNVTPLDEKDLFGKGLVIRRTWIMPGSYWEYSVYEVGKLSPHPAIAIKSSRQAAYNAALRWLDDRKAGEG